MFLRIKRHLMAEADQGGASGNPVIPATAPASENVPQAQGAPVVTKEIADFIQSELTKREAEMRDKIFAEARRTFTEKRNKPKDESPSPAPSAPQQIDPHEERRVLRDFDRTVSRLGLHDKINPTQWGRAEKALLAERPDDVASWVKDYFEGFGVAPTPAPAQQQAAPAAPPKPANDHPESNRGGSPPSRAPLVEADLVTMAASDRDALIREKGVRWYHQQLAKQLKDKIVQVRR